MLEVANKEIKMAKSKSKKRQMFKIKWIKKPHKLKKVSLIK